MIFISTPQEIPGWRPPGVATCLPVSLLPLLVRVMRPLRAAILGVYLHGKSGDLAAEKLGFEGVIAGDIAKNTGAAIFDLFETTQNQSNQ